MVEGHNNPIKNGSKEFTTMQDEILKQKDFPNFNEAGYDATIVILHEAAELY